MAMTGTVTGRHRRYGTTTCWPNRGDMGLMVENAPDIVGVCY